MTYKCVVPTSGGKDSQACLKMAIETFGAENVLGLFCDTQFEHPLTYQHIETMRELYGVRIAWVTGGDVLSKSVKYGRFPGGGSRHCTDELKIRETRIYLAELATIQGSIRSPKRKAERARRATGGFEVWYGMRWSESSERKTRYENKISTDLYHPHEVLTKYPKYLGKMGVRFRLPLVDWTTDQVKDYVGRESLNPLYEDFDRVGCFPCLAAGDEYKEKAFAYDDFGREQHRKVIMIGQQIGKSIWTSKGGKKRNECAICTFG